MYFVRFDRVLHGTGNDEMDSYRFKNDVHADE